MGKCACFRVLEEFFLDFGEFDKIFVELWVKFTQIWQQVYSFLSRFGSVRAGLVYLWEMSII